MLLCFFTTAVAIKFKTISRSAFTLVELLVVMAIIGVLIGLLVPAVQAAREAARIATCRTHVKELALASLNHENTHKIFPTGGWFSKWLGHPDRGFGRQQPGGWIYNTLPFIEQQALHDLGAQGSGVAIEMANETRIQQPLAIHNCPSRRPLATFRLYNKYFQFYLTNQIVLSLARSDYAMNGGDYFQVRSSPTTLDEADSPAMPWNDMSQQNGLTHERSQVQWKDIKDGSSNTYLLGEKYVPIDFYLDGRDVGDNETMYSGDDLDLIRFTGIVGAIKAGDHDNGPKRDRSILKAEGSYVQWFGGPHANCFNMAFCDGSVRAVSYSIDLEAHRRLGNRADGGVVDLNRL